MENSGEGDSGYKPNEEKRDSSPTFSRRTLLKGGLGLAGLAALTKLGLDSRNSNAENANPLEFKEDEELAKEHPVKGIMRGITTIRLDTDLKFRTEPQTTDEIDGRNIQEEFYFGHDLAELNGVELQNATSIDIENLLIRKGADVDGVPSENGGNWISIRARIDRPGPDTDKTLFINYSNLTEGYVTAADDAQLIDAKVENGMLKYFDGTEYKPINPAVINKVLLPMPTPPTQ